MACHADKKCSGTTQNWKSGPPCWCWPACVGFHHGPAWRSSPCRGRSFRAPATIATKIIECGGWLFLAFLSNTITVIIITTTASPLPSFAPALFAPIVNRGDGRDCATLAECSRTMAPAGGTPLGRAGRLDRDGHVLWSAARLTRWSPSLLMVCAPLW